MYFLLAIFKMRLTTKYHVLSLETSGPHCSVLSWPRCHCIALSDSQTVICNPINIHISHKIFNRTGSGPELRRTVNLKEGEVRCSGPGQDLDQVGFNEAFI